MNDYSSKSRFASPTLPHGSSSFAAAEMSQGGAEGKTKFIRTQTFELPLLWLGNPEKGQRKMEKERGAGGAAWSRLEQSVGHTHAGLGSKLSLQRDICSITPMHCG